MVSLSNTSLHESRNQVDIGSTIRRLRQLYGLSQIEFAKRAGISQSHLSFIEKGQRIAHQDVLEKIGNMLQIPVAMLMLMSMTEDDVPANKRQLFARARPKIDSVLKELFPMPDDSTK